MKKIIIEEEKLGDITYWDYLLNVKEDDFKKLKKDSKNMILKAAYKKAPISIRQNKSFILKAIQKSCLYFWDIDDEIKDKEFCMEYIKVSNHPSLTGIPEKYHNDFFKTVVIKNPYAIKDIFYNKNLASYSKKDEIYDLVKANPKTYKHLLDSKFIYKFYNVEVDIFGFELAEIAALKDPLLLFDMNKTMARKIISKNIDMGMELLKTRRDIFGLLPLKYRSDKILVNKYISSFNFDQFKYIGKNLLLDKEIVLKITYFYEVKLPQEMWENREVAMHILNLNSYLDSKIKDCINYTVEELVCESIRKNKNIYLYSNLSQRLQENVKIIIALLEVGYYKVTTTDRNKSYLDPYRTQTVEKSVISLLPADINESVRKKYESIEGNNSIKVSQEDYLLFMRSYFISQDLNEYLNDKGLIIQKKLKI